MKKEEIKKLLLDYSGELLDRLGYSDIDENDTKKFIDSYLAVPSKVSKEDEPEQKEEANPRRSMQVRRYDFVVKHKTAIYQLGRKGNYSDLKNDPYLINLIYMARKEIGFSDKTYSGDIFHGLVKLYKKICV